ncbi:MAG: dihydropteroate synthase, partial [Flavobacteriaceae bacterium]
AKAGKHIFCEKPIDLLLVQQKYRHNYELLRHLDLFQSLELPLLVGISRKSMIYKKLGINAEEAGNGTTVLNSLAITKGANILRVHDVKEAKECVLLLDAL